MNNKNEKQIEKKVTELSEIAEKLAMADIQRIALAPSRQIQELVKTATRMTEDYSG